MSRDVLAQVRLRDAGSVMIGKTATPEFGFPPYTEPRTGPGGAIVMAVPLPQCSCTMTPRMVRPSSMSW